VLRTASFSTDFVVESGGADFMDMGDDFETGVKRNKH
jgi:hypothetical protein